MLDSVSLVMFAFVVMLGFIFLVLGFNELKGTLEENQKGTPATPAMGTIYFVISMILWFVLSMYWGAMATDSALATLSYLWDGFAIMSMAFFWVCVGYILKGSFKATPKSKFEVRETESE